MDDHSAPSAHAVVVTRPGVLELSRVGVGSVGLRDVLIRTLFSGVSTGTDKWVMNGVFTWSPVQFPAVPGYQRVGVIEALGDDVVGFEIGQQVVATGSLAFTGASAAWGAHASLAVSRADEVYDATGIVPERASLFISGQVGFNAASRLPEAARVVVFGDGIIGVSGALAAQARGCAVLLVGRHPERLDPVHALGIETIVVEEAAGAIRAWAPTAVIDTVQNEEAFDLYVEALPQRTGFIVFSGHSPGGATTWADMERMQQLELTAAFVSGWAPDRIEGTLELMRTGSMPLEQLAVVSAIPEIEATMRDVASGALRPVAAILDWRAAEE